MSGPRGTAEHKRCPACGGPVDMVMGRWRHIDEDRDETPLQWPLTLQGVSKTGDVEPMVKAK